ncbi:MAG TPA: nuclease-related domain-containing protein [Xanthobacteraceae bacterium]|nr:nuclease-related domain-containing protein [Xanthobacteraceae bacterium]
MPVFARAADQSHSALRVLVGAIANPALVPRQFVRRACELLPRMVRSSFPRRQQRRRLRRTAASSAAAIAAGVLAMISHGAGAPAVAGALVLVTIGLVIDTRRWLRLAGRSCVGARSEDAVRGALAALDAEGWRLCHSLPYRGRGDIDSVAIAPTGVAFAIETTCAARRPVVSPVQPGGTRREVLGSNGLPGSER